MWGPAGSAAWARSDQPYGGVPQPSAQAQAQAQAQPQVPAQPNGRTGSVGTKLDIQGPEGEWLTVQLVEVVDPADFLFTAAGYHLQDGDRAVVVHTEFTNHGPVGFPALPDLHLVLVAKDGSTVSKAPVSLSSRAPHRGGVQPGETAGGHTVYVLPESTELVAVRWTPRLGDEQRTLTWDVSDT